MRWFISRFPYPWELLLFLLSGMVRYYNNLDPAAIVFDEVHFGGFVEGYHTGHYFFDIHPPLGKLSLLWLGYLFGYDPSACEYKNISDVYPPGCKFYILRRIAATFGCMLAPLTFSIARKLGVSTSAAFLAGCFAAFDMMNVLESRHILVDSQLMFYCALSLWLGLKWFKRCNEGPMSVSTRNWWCLALGVSCSCALSIKWTTLATPGMLAVEATMAIFFLKTSVPTIDLLKIGSLCVGLYAFWYYVHFAYLPLSGEHGDAFMPIEFQRTLINSKHYDPNAPKVSFPWITAELNREMYAASARIDVPHTWQSVHYQWMLNLRGVLYWSQDISNTDMRRQIYILGNPIVSWFCFACVIVFVVAGMVSLRYRSLFSGKRGLLASGSFCLVAYMCNLLPYLGVTRQAFIYHYMPGLHYASLLSAVVVELVVPDRFRGKVVGVVVAASVLFFIYLSPWVYGTPTSFKAHANRRWISTWD